MVNTDLFGKKFGSTSNTSAGMLSIDGITPQTATIKLASNTTTLEGVITTFTFADMNTHLKHPFTFRQVELVQWWQIAKQQHEILVFSNDRSTAFSLTSSGDTEALLTALLVANQHYTPLRQLHYFNEEALAYEMLKHGFTLPALKMLPGLTAEHMALYLNKQMDLDELSQLGFKLPQLNEMPIKKATLIFRNARNLSQLHRLGIPLSQIYNLAIPQLTLLEQKSYEFFSQQHFKNYITLPQMLGLSHQPPSLPKQLSNNYLARFPSISTSTYSYQVKVENAENKADEAKQTETISYEVKTTLTKEFLLLQHHGNQHHIDFHTGIPVNYPLEPVSETLIHTWYTSVINGNTHKICFALNMIVTERHDAEFPESLKTCLHQLAAERVMYFIEKAFIQFLASKGFTLATYKALPGNSHEKIVIMATHLSAIRDLLQQGLSLNELARTNTKRLLYVLDNYAEAQKAYDFVDARELLGLNYLPSVRQYSLFNRLYHIAEAYLPAAVSEPVSECRIM